MHCGNTARFAIVASSFWTSLWLAASVTVAGEPSPAAAFESIQLKTLVAEPLECRANLLKNASFEQTDAQGIPAGWQWHQRNTDATCVIDRNVVHRGRQSIKITNGTASGAHVYAMLIAEPVKLVEGKSYTMSMWVRSYSPGTLGLIGGAEWQLRALATTSTQGQWRRVWKTFTAGPRDGEFVLRINTESPTGGVWIDDVKLEEGTFPSPDQTVEQDASRTHLDTDEPEAAIGGDGAFSLAFHLINPEPVDGTLEATLGPGLTLREPIRVAAGAWQVLVKGEAMSASDTPRTIALRLEQGGKETARTEQQVRFYSSTSALKRLDVVKAAIPKLKADLEKIASQGQDVSYPRITFTVLENFVGYVEEDVQRGEVRRALQQLGDLEAMASRLSEELKDAQVGHRRFAAVPRWTGTKRPTIKSSSFLAAVRLSDGSIVERPVFFNGFGHFGQVVTDMEKWPDYGTNIIQIEFGPNSIFPSEGSVSDTPVQAMLKTLDRAQKAGVAVCLLISPHYFPQWAMAKWPHLSKHREGFLQYCLHAPEGQELLRRYIATAIEPLKNHPALHSICLSNEPVNAEEPCQYARDLWLAWLEERHGEIAALNACYGTTYAAFGDVPLPNPFEPHPAMPLWVDYVRFNQDFFAKWHTMLADAVHAVAPGLPVHAKAMAFTFLNSDGGRFGVSAALFGRFSNINGNDSVNLYGFGVGESAQSWLLNAMSHDLQRSVLDAPVFNSENHIIEDRDVRYVPAAHIRAALWQAAVHGQSATAIWVWERCFDPKSNLYGSIMHRPGCAEAVGVVNCDLNRAALEVTALQQARPQVLLLESGTTAVWQLAGYMDCLAKLYTAISFSGLKLGFITERQLEEGVVPNAAVLCVPSVTHLSDAAMASLRKFKGRVVFVGEGELLSHDEYGRPREPGLQGEKIAFRYTVTSARDLYSQLVPQLAAWKIRPEVELRGTDGQAVWGVEWRCAETADGCVVNLCNYQKTPVAVSLTQAGRDVGARDVLSDERVEGPLKLQPLDVRLLRVDQKTP